MIKKYLTPPIFEDAEKTATARLLYLVLYIDTVVCLVFLIPFYIFSPESIIRYLLLSAIVLGANIVSLVFARRKKLQLASIILLVSLWISIMAGTVTGGGVSSPIYAGTFVVIIVAGLLLGDRAAVITAILSVLFGAIMVSLENAGHLRAVNANTNLSILISYSFFISLTVVFQRISSRSIREALKISQDEVEERLRTEQALRQSEERYRLISSISSDYMFSTVMGPDGKLYLNWVAGAFEQITGYTFEEYVARGGWSAALHPDDREQDSRDMAALQKNQSVASEVRTIHKNGDIRWVRVYAQPLWDNKGNMLVGIYGAVQEITAAKQAEEELEQHAEEMYILYQISLVLSTGQDMYETLRKLLDHLRHLFILDTFYIGVYDPVTGLISYPLYENLNETMHVTPRVLRDNPGMSGEVVFKRRTLYISDMDAPSAQKAHAPIVVGQTHIRSFLGIPMLAHGNVIGLVSIQSQQPNAYNEKQIRLLETIAAQLGTVLDKANLLDKLQKELLERKLAEEEIRKLNAELEQRVLERTIALSESEFSLRERTLQLEAANKELEAFAYSVSHDLRAPLRAVKGFSQILLKDFAGNLDGEGLDFLQRISLAASQMSELIESLLSLSRLTRGELNRTDVNLTLMAQEILDKFHQQEPERQVACTVAGGLHANVDPRLIRTALENLLGNAWKYTSKTESPIIEVGSMKNDDQMTVYFVRDNGVGFDMAHADKLFGAFQRLHSEAEFPGHGIGLATIQRIIHRHGGMIWAEAEPGKGATFFFTLDNEARPTNRDGMNG